MLKDHLPLSLIQFSNTAETWQQTELIATKLRHKSTLIASPYLERRFPLYDESESYFLSTPPVVMKHFANSFDVSAISEVINCD